jgi:hypothetical protein
MATATGTYYVHVIPVVAGATYTITASFVSGVVVDGNDTFATAQAVSVGSSFVAIIASATDEDWYKFTTAGPGTITVTLSGLSADADLELYGNVAAVMVDFSYMGGTMPDTVSYTATGPVTYHVRVVPRGAVTPYTLTIGLTP